MSPSCESPLWKAGTKDTRLRCGDWKGLGKPQVGCPQRLLLGGWGDGCTGLSGGLRALRQINVGCFGAACGA